MACWQGYVQKGMKKKGKKMVPNCVPRTKMADGGLVDVPISNTIKFLEPNGKILILVWALEQEPDSRRKFTEQDNMVDWKDKKGNLLGKRYYYVFKQNELESLIHNKNMIVESFYEKGNWGVVLKKV